MKTGHRQAGGMPILRSWQHGGVLHGSAPPVLAFAPAHQLSGIIYNTASTLYTTQCITPIQAVDLANVCL